MKWLNPGPGSTGYASSAQLVFRWDDRKDSLDETARSDALHSHNENVGYRGEEDPIASAIQIVIEVSGEQVSFWHGSASGKPEAFNRLRLRAGLSPELNSHAGYVDRSGVQYVPFDEALEIARGFCARGPAAILSEVQSTR